MAFVLSRSLLGNRVHLTPIITSAGGTHFAISKAKPANLGSPWANGVTSVGNVFRGIVWAIIVLPIRHCLAGSSAVYLVWGTFANDTPPSCFGAFDDSSIARVS